MCTTHTTARVLPTAIAAATGFGDTGLDSTGIPDEEAYLHQYMDALQRRLAPRGVAVEEFLRVESNGLPANWLFFVSFAFFRVSAILQVCQNMLFVCCSFQYGRLTQFDHPTSLPLALPLALSLDLNCPLSRPPSLAPLSRPLSRALPPMLRALLAAQGVYKRALMGNASSANAKQVGSLASVMADISWKCAQEHSAKRKISTRVDTAAWCCQC